MTGLPKGAGSVPLKDISPEAVESLLSSPEWQRRLEEARAQREKVLAERARLDSENPERLAPKRPWEREPHPAARRPRQTVDRDAVAAARADALLPGVMRAMRAAPDEAGRTEVARVVPLSPPPVTQPPVTQPDAQKADAQKSDVTSPRAEGRALAGSGLQRVSERITFAAPRAAPDPRAVDPARDGKPGTLTPAMLNPADLPPVGVAPMVAAGPARRRPFPVMLAAAFAAGAIIGGSAFLWFGHPLTRDPVASLPQTTDATASAVEKAAAAGAAPDVQTDVAAGLARPVPDAALPAAVPGATLASAAIAVPAPLAPPAIPDGAAEVLHAEGITPGSPAAVSGAGFEDPLDVAFPQADAEPARVTAPHDLAFSGSGIDRLPTESALPGALPTAPGIASGQLGALTFAADAGEALSFPLPAASTVPGRIAHPEIGDAAQDEGSEAAAIADPAVFQTAAPLPVLVGAAFPDLAIRILKSARATDAAVSDVSRIMVRDGFVKPTEKPLSVKIRVSHVRFYHDADRTAALAVATSLGIGAQQFPPPGAAAIPGTIEVWVGSSSSPDAAAASSTKATAAAKSKKSATSTASKRRQAERDQMRVLREKILQQLRDGVQP